MALPDTILASLKADRLVALAPVLTRLGVECAEDLNFIEASDVLLHMPEITVVQRRRFEAWREAWRAMLRPTNPSLEPEPATEPATQELTRNACKDDPRRVGEECPAASSEVSSSAWDNAGIAAATARATHALRESLEGLSSLGDVFSGAVALRQTAEGAGSGSLCADPLFTAILEKVAEARRYVEDPSAVSAVGAAYALLMLNDARRMASAIEKEALLSVKHVKAPAVPVRDLVMLHVCRRAGGHENADAFKKAFEDMVGAPALDRDPDLVANIFNARSHTFYPGERMGSRWFKKKPPKSYLARKKKRDSECEGALQEAAPGASSAGAHVTLLRSSSPMRKEVVGLPEDDDDEDEERESGADVIGRIVWLALSEKHIAYKKKARNGLQQAPPEDNDDCEWAESDEERHRQ